MDLVFPRDGVLYPAAEVPDRRPLLGTAVYDLMIPKLMKAEDISREQAEAIMASLFTRLEPYRPPVVIWPVTRERCRELLASAQLGLQLGHKVN